MSHEPVLLHACITGLRIISNGTYVDATFGGGGHSKAILNELGEDGKLFAFDQDLEAKNRIWADERLSLIPENFRNMKRFLRLKGVKKVDGILADLGMSSFQLDSNSRGFATRFDAELDMRMNQNHKKKASHILNRYSSQQLQLVFQNYGEVRNARSLADFIVGSRDEKAFTTTFEFIERIDPFIKGNRARYLAQLFQALRIEVNEEMAALDEFLIQSAELLEPKGRLVVLTFHSLEDRRVKNFIRTGSVDGEIDKDLFGNWSKPMTAINKKVITAEESELKNNPRSRSAKLRIAEKDSE